VTDPMTPIAPIGDDDLQAWADRRMPLDRRDAIEAYLAAHPEVVTRMARYAVHDAGLTAALQPKFEEPIPARLRIETLLAGRRSRMTAHLARAAGLLLMTGLGAAAGWIGHSWTTEGTQLRAATVNAVAAYETYTVEARHPVEVRADEGAHLVQWISNRLERPITPPDLSPLGWRLMGGRVLPTAHAPAAQMMYDDDHGTRLTVYLQPMDIDGEEFRYSQQGDIRTIVWAERRLALVVTGKVTQARLMAVAQRVRDGVGAGGAP
jgi:anti-sigma factor RsiW